MARWDEQHLEHTVLGEELGERVGVAGPALRHEGLHGPWQVRPAATGDGPADRNHGAADLEADWSHYPACHHARASPTGSGQLELEPRSGSLRLRRAAAPDGDRTWSPRRRSYGICACGAACQWPWHRVGPYRGYGHLVMKIRRAVPDDGDVLGEIHAASWEAAYGSLLEPGFVERAVQERRSRWHGRIVDPVGTVLLASIDERPIALSFVVASSTRSGWAEIYSFYCHPAGWGSGAARALMIETLQLLRTEGVAGVHLWTLAATGRSRRFYVKSGFTETGATRAHDFGDGQPFAQVEYQRSC